MNINNVPININHASINTNNADININHGKIDTNFALININHAPININHGTINVNNGPINIDHGEINVNRALNYASHASANPNRFQGMSVSINNSFSICNVDMTSKTAPVHISYAPIAINDETTRLYQPIPRLQAQNPSAPPAEAAPKITPTAPLGTQEQIESSDDPAPVNPECPICQLPISNRHPVAMMCGHLYCRECIERSLSIRKECPVCRQYLTTDRPFTNVRLDQ